MASIVKVPKDNKADYDFIAFSFDGLHSYEDFGLYRTSDGDRYNENLAPQMTDRTADNPARDGQYYFGTQHKQRVFDINFAFDYLTEAKLSSLKKWLNGKKIADLWFAEAPYKVYSAKVTGTPNIKALCFDEQYDDNGESKTRRIYKGEGSVQFTCYYPYAHTPDLIDISQIAEYTGGVSQFSGESKDSYRYFSNFQQIEGQLPGGTESPFGEAPFHFVAYLSGPNEVAAASINAQSPAGATQTYSYSDGKQISYHLAVNKDGATLTGVAGVGTQSGKTLILGG